MESSGSGDGADNQRWVGDDGAAGAGMKAFQGVVDARADPGVTRKKQMSGVGTSIAPFA
jgi:hypothetical protein